MVTTAQSSILFNNATIGIIVVDCKGIIEAINPFALNLFGYDLEEVIEKPIELLIPKRYHQDHVNHIDSYLHHTKNRPMGIGMDLYAVKKDGTEFPVEISLGKTGNKNVIAFLSDISIRKKAESEIKRLKEDLEIKVDKRTKDLQDILHKLEISRDKLRLSKDLLGDTLAYQNALLDNAGAMIIATDDKGIIKLFNPEAETKTGYKQWEVVNKQTPLIFHKKDEINIKRTALYNKFGIKVESDFSVMVEKSRRNIHEEEQYTFIRKDGTSFPVSLTITAIRDKEKSITGFMGIVIDISKRKKAEEDLQKALEKEKDLNELKSRFVSMASHEFRTPLSTVLSSAYLIQKYMSTDEQPNREKHLHRIISSVNMLTDILNDFLSLGKIEEGKIHVKPYEFNVVEFIAATTEEIKSILKKQQQLQCRHHGYLTVNLDSTLLKHIIVNLVSNASKFSSETGRIKIKTNCIDHQVILSVKDNGIGISKEDQKHLMERFFRGANAGNIQGTGLGLHIVSKYAEIMNGKVQCKSELGKGTEFIITFTINTE